MYGWKVHLLAELKQQIFFEIPVSWMDIHHLHFVQTATIILACLSQVAHLSLYSYDSSTLAVSTIQLQPQPVGHTVSVSNHDIMCSECPPWPHTTQKFDNPMGYRILFGWITSARKVNAPLLFRQQTCLYTAHSTM